MKKLLVLLLVLGITGVASAELVPGTFKADPSLPQGAPGTIENPLRDSDVVFIDIVGYSNYGEAMGINSTGALRVSIDGPAEFVGNPDYTYYEDFEFRPGTFPNPDWLGGNEMVLEDPQNLTMFGFLPSGAFAFLWGAGDEEVILFDHIGIHCLGQGDVIVTVQPATDSNPFGRPIVITPTSGGLQVDPQAVGSSITIHQVPEPITMGLLSLGGLALLRRRR